MHIKQCLWWLFNTLLIVVGLGVGAILALIVAVMTGVIDFRC